MWFENCSMALDNAFENLLLKKTSAFDVLLLQQKNAEGIFSFCFLVILFLVFLVYFFGLICFLLQNAGNW